MRYEAGARKTRRTPAAKAQRFFLFAALLFGAATFGVVLLSPEIPWYASTAQPPQLLETPAPTPFETSEPTPTITPEPTATATPQPTPTVTPEPTPTATPQPTTSATPQPSLTLIPEAVSPTPETAGEPTPVPEAGGTFGGVSGDYPVVVFLSEADSEDPETQRSADALFGEQFGGTITLDVDANGDGRVSIDQGFFPPDEIAVSAFIDSNGAVSENTLYGTLMSGGYKLTVVCVCSENSVSGFLWMDDELTHIEFLYFG
jgi:hypothetical protein